MAALKGFLCLALVCALACTAAAVPAAAPAAAAPSDAVLDTIAHMNHLNWVVTRLRHAGHELALEEEYARISPGRLNLNRIPDRETLTCIQRLLDEISALRSDAREMAYWREEFELTRNRRRLAYWGEAVSNIVTGAAQAAGGAVAAFRDPMTLLNSSDTVDALGGGLSRVIASLDVFGDGFEEREKLEELQVRFQFESKQLNRLHQRNREMLADQWQLIRKHSLDDRYRVSEEDLLALLRILDDPDASRRYHRLEALKPRFPLFARYWYHLAASAYAAQERDAARAACETFFRVNRGLFKNDTAAGTLSLINALLLEPVPANRRRIRQLLEAYAAATAHAPDWMADATAALLYSSALADRPAAAGLLKRSLLAFDHLVEQRFEAIRRHAAQQGGRAGAIVIPEGEVCLQLHTLLHEVASALPGAADAAAFPLMPSPLPELQLALRHPSESCYLKRFAAEVSRISLLHNDCAVRLPLSWFLAGDPDVTITPVVEGCNRATFRADRSQRRITADGQLELTFPGLRRLLQEEGVDTFDLTFACRGGPLTVRFAPSAPPQDRFPPVDNLWPYEIRLAGKPLYRVLEPFSAVRAGAPAPGADWGAAFRREFGSLTRLSTSVTAIAEGPVASIELRGRKAFVTLRPCNSNLLLTFLDRNGAVLALHFLAVRDTLPEASRRRVELALHRPGEPLYLHADAEAFAATPTPAPQLTRPLKLTLSQQELAATYRRAVNFYTGETGPRNLSEAVRLFTVVATHGYPPAQYHLARMHQRGESIPRNLSEAARLYRLAADQGFAPAQNDLAALCQAGEGVPRDLPEAARLYRLAAAQGYAPAQYNLALLHTTAEGELRDLPEAARLFRLAAETGIPIAYYNLAVLYYNGDGVTRDVEAARHFMRLAAEQGISEAETWLRSYK